ncbi:GyrI-like domain-containing protein [Luteimonas sp. RD2P54]|uniref:GyrI-like domain-containing protein n=1 Tax=Luteimonas endophytica TaxID=3042023 RepID=A0ABT6J4Y0_9GAMM|nr:GyrI-like domain-containing protein [Luteimonas endophytica]MDH5821881.1 GyrI-like domain-containing protein [Luteimonas endophytica]
MSKLDLKKNLGGLYRASANEIAEIDAPAFDFLMIDGSGDPNTSAAYREAVEALFSVAYKVKFAIKQGGGRDYVVMPLEGLWWADDMATFHAGDKARWQWTMMIMQPPFVTASDVPAAIAAVRRKNDLPGLAKLRFETFQEGRCAQILHIGPFSEEGPTIQKVHDYILSRGALRGKHHEIYLSDPRRAAPQKLRTIIRQPMG